MASLLRSPTLVMPLQKRASTDLISHENRISGYSDDIAAADAAKAEEADDDARVTDCAGTSGTTWRKI